MYLWDTDVNISKFIILIEILSISFIAIGLKSARLWVVIALRLCWFEAQEMLWINTATQLTICNCVSKVVVQLINHFYALRLRSQLMSSAFTVDVVCFQRCFRTMMSVLRAPWRSENFLQYYTPNQIAISWHFNYDSKYRTVDNHSWQNILYVFHVVCWVGTSVLEFTGGKVMHGVCGCCCKHSLPSSPYNYSPRMRIWWYVRVMNFYPVSPANTCITWSFQILAGLLITDAERGRKNKCKNTLFKWL